ncbi:hypothetical protein SDC9_196633 [bioreactor metagenome]|uniref:Uncharacterized protein n=1 Tax=bioreactor metagenome TaxID=1076179 RepID=A0A645ID10_9ZZZZ
MGILFDPKDHLLFTLVLAVKAVIQCCALGQRIEQLAGSAIHHDGDICGVQPEAHFLAVPGARTPVFALPASLLAGVEAAGSLRFQFRQNASRRAGYGSILIQAEAA